jgi:hypothetical protein
MSETTGKRRRGRPATKRDESTGDSLPKETNAADAPLKPPPAAKEPKPAARGAGRPSSRDKLEQSLAEQLGAIALTLSLFNPRDGQAIMRRAPECAASLARLADQNPKIKRLLESGMTSSAWLGVAIAFGGLGMELAANHGAAPALFSTPAPESSGAGDLFGNLAHLFPKAAPAPPAPSSNGSAP